MRIGVWLDIPGAAIREGEGLLRLLSLIFKGFAPTDHEIIIVASTDARKPSEPWFKEFADGARCRFSFVTPRSGVYDSPGEREQRTALARKLAVDGWLAFRAERHAIDDVPGPWTSIFADFILAEFPMHFSEAVYRQLVSPTREGVWRMDRLVCFSEHVKQVHGVDFFGAREDQVRVIPHAPFDYFDFARPGFEAAAKTLSLGPIQTAADLTRSAAADIVRHHIRNQVDGYFCQIGASYIRPVLASMAYEDMDFVLISSRNRPHKNFLTALQAIEHLIRDQYSSIKAMTTSPLDLTSDEPVSRYIVEHKLHQDLLSINHLPAHVHAALYRLAAVTVHPSPFEGGFPFTFPESLSMGTPIIMARGPAVEEFLTKGELDAYCFEPSSPLDLARRIDAVLGDREAYMARQLETLERQKLRTWRNIADEYVEVFQEAARVYWAKGDLWVRTLAADDAGSAPGAGFIGLDSGRMDGPRSILERYIPASAVGVFQIDLDFRDGAPDELARNIVVSCGAWDDSGLQFYDHTNVRVSSGMTDDHTRVSITIDLPAEDLGRVKELRGGWNGGVSPVLERVSWRLTAW